MRLVDERCLDQSYLEQGGRAQVGTGTKTEVVHSGKVNRSLPSNS